MTERLDVRILGFAGSARQGSFNKQALGIALRGAEKAGAEVVRVDLREYPLPLYDGDLEAEQGLPDNAAKLAGMLRESDALLLASPEYNGFLPALLKNTLDWMSRSPSAQPDLSAFQGKFVAILAASPGPLGGLRALRGVRELLTNLGMTVLTNQITVRSAFQAFDEQGEMLDADQAQRLEALGAELARTTARQKRPL